MILPPGAAITLFVGFTSSAVALVVSAVARKTAREIHQERLKADLQLAEKKFALDQALTMWRRRYELAEQVLTAAYEAREALAWARARVIFSGEGQSRKATETENEKLRERRNSYYVPLERLARDAKGFATLQTMRFMVSAHFGPELVKPIAAFAEVHNEITSTAGILIQQAFVDDHDVPSLRQSLHTLRDKLWGERPDEMDKKIDAAVVQIEAFCRPVLSEPPPK